MKQPFAEILMEHQEALMAYCRVSRRDPVTLEFVNNGDAIAEIGGLIIAIHDWHYSGKLQYCSIKRFRRCFRLVPDSKAAKVA